MTAQEIDLLLIHPHGHLLDDWEVPIGAITSANTVPGRKLGVYAWECSDEQIRSARVVGLDWYWHFSLPAVRAVVSRVRRVSPKAPIVVGGLTASWFGPRVFDLLPVDYVAVGDAEVGMERLVEMAVRGGTSEVPANTLRSDGRAGPRVVLDQDRFDSLDPISVEGWFPSLSRARSAPIVMLTRGCSQRCSRICLAEEVSGAPLRIHSVRWVADVLRAARRASGPEVPIRLVNVGARDESRLIGILDDVASDTAVGPLAVWTYGTSREFLDYLLDRCPDARIGLLSPWEVLGWPHREVSDASVGRALFPIEHMVERLRRTGRGSLTLHLPRRFHESRPDLVDRVRSDRTTLAPSDGFYIWTPESPAGRDLPIGEQLAKMNEMGELAARVALTEQLVPDLMRLYPMRRDPNWEPDREPPLPELAGFHALVLEGWRRLNVLAPQPFELEVHVVQREGRMGEAALLAPSLPAFALPHPVFAGASVQVTESGSELGWTSPALEEPEGEALALVVLPNGLGDLVRTRPMNVMSFPAPARKVGDSLRLWLRATPTGLEWKLRSWRDAGASTSLRVTEPA